MRLSTIVLATASLFVAGVVAPEEAEAQTRFGPEVAYADDFDLGVGGRAVFDIDAFSDDEDSILRQLRLIGEFVYYLDPFECDDCGAWQANANGAVPLNLGEADVYAGAGLGYTNVSVDTAFGDFGDSDIGLNLLAGLNFGLGSLAAFGEAGIQLGGAEQFTIKGGLLFGG